MESYNCWGSWNYNTSNADADDYARLIRWFFADESTEYAQYDYVNEIWVKREENGDLVYKLYRATSDGAGDEAEDETMTREEAIKVVKDAGLFLRNGEPNPAKVEMIANIRGGFVGRDGSLLPSKCRILAWSSCGWEEIDLWAGYR